MSVITVNIKIPDGRTCDKCDFLYSLRINPYKTLHTGHCLIFDKKVLSAKDSADNLVLLKCVECLAKVGEKDERTTDTI